MSVNLAGVTPYDQEQYLRERALKNARLGLLLWRIANGLVFIFFGFANALMRQAQPSWPPPGVARLDATLPIIVTGVILLSGITASRALAQTRKNHHGAAQTAMLATIGLGVAFLVGLLVAMSQVPYSGPYSSIVLTMNGFHAAHVVVASLMMGYIYLKSRRGAYSSENHWGVEAVVIFWHFVDLMWLFFFAVIYVL